MKNISNPLKPRKTGKEFLRDLRKSAKSVWKVYRNSKEGLEFIPTDTTTLEDLGSGPLYYRVSCYRLFTDVEKLRRANKNAESAETSRTDYQADPSTSNYSRRRSARHGPILNTLLSKRPNKDVLPNFCLICKIPGTIWITDKVLILNLFEI